MVGQICSVGLEGVARVGSGGLLAGLQLGDLGLIMKEGGLRWFGRVAGSGGAVGAACGVRIGGGRGAGRGARAGMELAERGCCGWKLTAVDPQERSTWRSGVRSAMRAASQLPGKGPTDVDDAPAR